MAKLPAICAALAELDGRGRPTIDFGARVLREADLIARSKRGLGSSAMTSADAVNLLLGVNGAESIKEAPDAVRRYRSLVSTARSRSKTPVFAAIEKAKDLGAALEILVDRMPEVIALATAFIAGRGYKDGGALYAKALTRSAWDSPVLFDVILARYHARIVYKEEDATRLDLHFGVQGDLFGEGFYGTQALDRRPSVAISGLTFWRMHETLFATKSAS